MDTTLNLDGTPYYLSSDAGGSVGSLIRELTERVELLRRSGKLTTATLRAYYGDKRIEQIAESNAIEGSPLSVGETELAVLKGITITGHDPGYSNDARSLARAVDELVTLAKSKGPTDQSEIKRVHELVLGERPGGGIYRSQEVRISGSAHVPPRGIKEVLDQMESWEKWSTSNPHSPVLLRAVTLHAWLTHVHPFIDGNGRTARAVGNLEFLRGGYPPVIIRRKDREQYLDALGKADDGDLSPFLELTAGRLEDALRDLERAAAKQQGYDVVREKFRKAQASRLAIWSAAVHLLFERLKSRLTELLPDAAVEAREFDSLTVDDFIDLSEGRPVRNSWAFVIRCTARGRPRLELLAWAGYLGDTLRAALDGDGRPALMWSAPNPAGYPPWTRIEHGGPGGDQFTLRADAWLVERGGRTREQSASELASAIANDIAERLVPASTM